MDNFNFFFVTLLFAVGSFAQTPFSGRCPRIRIQTEFDIMSFQGVWFEQAKYSSDSQYVGICATVRYIDFDGSKMTVYNMQRNVLHNDTTPHLPMTGYATLTATADYGDFWYENPGTPYSRPVPYKVISTDYVNYAIVYSCANYDVFCIKSVWVLTRVAEPTEEVMDMAYDVMDNNNLPRDYLVDTDQEFCWAQATSED